MMTNPVLDAVQQVKCAAWAFVDPPGAAEDIAERAARAALHPIRKLHRPTGTGSECVVCFDSEGRGQSWPCDTARLAYDPM